MGNERVETTIKEGTVTYKIYFDVPIELAFEAWSTQKHLEQWWGPDGFTITTKFFEFSNGGLWEFIMHGPDGRDYKNKIQFTDIKIPHHIYYKHLGDGEGSKDVDFLAKIIFEKAGDGTSLTLIQIFPSKEELERVDKKYHAIEGAKQHMANFRKYVESNQRKYF